MYKVVFTKRAKKEFLKLDRSQAIMITAWIEKNLENCTDPRAVGKPLTADFKGLWRYRVGDYRIITSIEDDTLLIVTMRIGHRKEIYE